MFIFRTTRKDKLMTHDSSHQHVRNKHAETAILGIINYVRWTDMRCTCSVIQSWVEPNTFFKTRLNQFISIRSLITRLTLKVTFLVEPSAEMRQLTESSCSQSVKTATFRNSFDPVGTFAAATAADTLSFRKKRLLNLFPTNYFGYSWSI